MAHRVQCPSRFRRPRPAAVAATTLAGICFAAAVSAGQGGSPLGDPIVAEWETFGTAHGLPSDKVLAVAVDGDRVWAGTDKGLARLERGAAAGARGTARSVVRTYGAGDGLPFPTVTALSVNRATGDLWIGTMGGLARWSGDRIDAFTQLDSGLVNDVVYGVASDGADVWVATAAGLNRFDTGSETWEIFDTSNTLMHEPWCYAVTASGGTVYVAVWGGGVIVRDAASGRFRAHRDPDGEMEIDLFRDDGLVHDVTSSVTVANGVMWVGTYFGLSRYDGRRWKSYGEDDSGLAGDFVNFVKARGDVVWIATDQGLSRFDSASWHTWRKRDGAPGAVLRITSPSGEARSLPLESGPANNTIYGLDLDRDGVWLATAAGLDHARTHERPETGRRAAAERRR